MYLPEHFREDDVAEMHALMRAHPFATLVTHGADGLIASHLPTVLKPDPSPFGTIEAHLARPNGQWKSADPDADALVIFTGPEHYIHPGWYPSKAEHGKVVPTWNYAAVHAYGRLEVVDDMEQLRQHVSELTAQQEAPRAAPWAVSDAPESYINVMLRGIVGVRLVISRLEGKWKMSQNRELAERDGVVQGLGGEADPKAAEVAALVAARKSD